MFGVRWDGLLGGMFLVMGAYIISKQRLDETAEF